MAKTSKTGIAVPKVLLPKAGVDLSKWAVIACDQFTSEPEYWEKVEQNVGDAPSTYRMILPEVYLEASDMPERVRNSQAAMQDYLDKGILDEREGFVFVERGLHGKTQKGLIVAMDLEAYDYNKDSQTLVRATEGTILDRLPPRIKVREGAALELPHIMVLYDDPDYFVLNEVLDKKVSLEKAYDFELMEGSGHLTGYYVDSPELVESVQKGLEKFIAPEFYTQRYGLSGDQKPLLFAMGDGNHSLATAKAIWEKVKGEVGMDHPARYALVELVNLHEESLTFEPIHRAIFNAGSDLVTKLQEALGPSTTLQNVGSFDEMTQVVAATQAPHQRFGLITPEGYQVFDLAEPHHNLPVANLQEFLDAYLAEHPEQKIDYVHGDDVIDRLGRTAGNISFYLPGIGKDSFFKSIILDGALPRKTFSMGHAKEKRFYMECRRITA